MGLSAHQAEHEGRRIHWVEAGEGGTPLVLLHGLSGSSRWWQRNIPALCAGRRVLVPDLIGFGHSRAEAPLPGLVQVAALLADWLGEQCPGGAHLVGHSMGGQLAIHLAARWPGRVRRLVLVDAVGIPRRHTPGDLARLAWEAMPPRRWGDPRFLPVIWRDALVAGPVTVLRGLHHILRDDVRPLLAGIRAPTLVLWGRRDGLVPLSQGRMLAREIPGARLLVLDGAYHNPMVDRPAEFNAAVNAFLAEEDNAGVPG
jgi:pimeloyl-ACP methyl ester carboxylesterase